MSDPTNQPFTIVPADGSDTDWCSEIKYTQVEPCAINQFMSLASMRRPFLTFPGFFGLSPGCCGGARDVMLFPPTDVGVDPSLPKLPLGFHYPQISTDRPHGRARAGRWAIERGKLYVAPWIQSSEAILIKWDGVKMNWADGDPFDPNPTLIAAVEEYVRWQHHKKWERDYTAAAAAEQSFQDARRDLIYDCKQQTRVRECESSQARGSQPTSLYYNTEQSYTAQCQDGTTGANVTVTIDAGTIGSVVSVADANQKAQDEAKQQATDRLVCTPNTPTFTNDQQSATAYCTGGTGAPQPDGSPKTVIVPAGTYTSTVSKEDANAQALAAAQSQAAAQLQCTYWNSEQTYTAVCQADNTKNVTKTIAAKTYSSTLSQADADAQALNAAKVAANAELPSTCSGTTVYHNTAVTGSASRTGCGAHPAIFSHGILVSPADAGCSVIVNVSVAANAFSSTVSQADANQQALNYANNYAQSLAATKCQYKQCGTFNINYPP